MRECKFEKVTVLINIRLFVITTFSYIESYFGYMTSRHTILYAEDDLDDLFMVKKAFEKHDHIEVIHATNGEDAFQRLLKMLEQGIKPCLVILDINMPVLNGRDALTKIKSISNFKDIPMVLFSTSSSPVDKQFAENHKVELITKPLHYQDLEKIARVFVDKCNFETDKLTSFKQ